MAEILSAKHSARVNSLVSDAFGYERPHCYFDDFPVWNLNYHADLNSIRSFGIVEAGQLMAHVGARLAKQKSGQNLTTIGIIGAVATDPLARGKGYSTQLLNEAIDWLHAQGAAWVILWGSEHQFYEKIGFHLAGKQFRAHIQDLPTIKKSFLPVKVQTGWCEEIFNALCAQDGIQTGDGDRMWIEKQKTVAWFYTEQPFSFVGYQRGLDLKHIIHEWGGDTNALTSIFSSLLTKDSDVQIIGTQSALRKLGLPDSACLVEHLCLAKSLKNGEIFPSYFWVNGLGAG